MPSDLAHEPKPLPRHSKFDDAQGMAFGSFMAAVAIVLLTHLGFVTGQTAGLAVLISYQTGWGFGPVFFVVNLPFYWLGYRRFGLGFTIRSLIAVTAVSILSAWLPPYLQFGTIHPAIGAILYGAMTGSALLALFRHGASLGGVGIVGLYIQDATGFRAGYVQMIFDACLFAAALMLRDWHLVAWSALGAVVLNLVVAVNHRRDRYIV